MIKIKEGYPLSLKVADHVSAMLAYWDKNQVCRYANSAYELWFGKKADDMIGRITMKELLGPLYELNLPYIQGALEGKKQAFERLIPSPDGADARYSLATYTPDIKDEEVLGFFVHVADITPVKKLELSLVENESRLQKSLTIIKDQNSRLINFAHLVSHNLRTHAGNLSSLLEILNESDSQEERAETLELLNDLSSAFTETVANLAYIADAKSKSHLTRKKINLYEYIQATLKVLALDIQSADCNIVVDVDTNLEADFNPAYIESILLNLISNSIKYRKPEVQLRVVITGRDEGNELTLAVSDNGKGINLEKYQNKVFGIYNTFHGNPNAKGVGLFISKYQAQAMGGDLRVESKEGIGSTFTLHIQKIACVADKADGLC
jgi:PAS domain S-box-containing protein